MKKLFGIIINFIEIASIDEKKKQGEGKQSARAASVDILTFLKSNNTKSK
jgi:hypothetical protein